MMPKNIVSQDSTRRLKSEHADLLTELTNLQELWPTYEEVVAARRVNALNAFQSECVNLRKRLVAHFTAEEEGGYLADALAVAPRLLHEAKRLLLEHGALLRTFDTILASVQSAETSPDSWADTTQRFGEFLARLRRHEQEENELVLESAEDDLGTGD